MHVYRSGCDEEPLCDLGVREPERGRAKDVSRLAKDMEATVRGIAKTWALSPREQLEGASLQVDRANREVRDARPA
jgi:hypothetical protein